MYVYIYIWKDTDIDIAVDIDTDSLGPRADIQGHYTSSGLDSLMYQGQWPL